KSLLLLLVFFLGRSRDDGVTDLSIEGLKEQDQRSYFRFFEIEVSDLGIEVRVGRAALDDVHHHIDQAIAEAIMEISSVERHGAEGRRLVGTDHGGVLDAD